MAPRFRVTYATLSADNDDLHTAYEQGLQTARSWFGSTLPVYVDGESRTTGETFEVRSPWTPPSCCAGCIRPPLRTLLMPSRLPVGPPAFGRRRHGRSA
jgi:hypothetical protein